MDNDKLKECQQTVRGKRLNATLYDYVLLMLTAKKTRLEATHSIPDVFKLKVTVELLEPANLN